MLSWDIQPTSTNKPDCPLSKASTCQWLRYTLHPASLALLTTLVRTRIYRHYRLMVLNVPRRPSNHLRQRSRNINHAPPLNRSRLNLKQQTRSLGYRFPPPRIYIHLRPHSRSRLLQSRSRTPFNSFEDQIHRPSPKRLQHRRNHQRDHSPIHA